MASTFRGLETGKSGINSAMLHLEVAGQNIANANTAGYTRQRVNSAAKVPPGSNYVISQIYNKRVGQGVETVGIEQIRSDYLDLQFRNLNSDFNYYEYRSQGLSYLTGVMNELSEEASITLALDNYISAMSKMAEDPSSEELRLNLQQSAMTLTETVNYVYGQMVDLAESQKDSVAVVVDDINAKAEQLANLNAAIANYERNGASANELRDQRNLLLDELAGLVDIEYKLNDKNPSMMDITIGGELLVEGRSFGSVSYSDENTFANPETGVKPYELLLHSPNELEPVVLTTKYSSVTEGNADLETIEITSGKLFAHMEMLENGTNENAGVPYYAKQLNMLAQDIAKTINDVHATGYTYPDEENGHVTQQGVNFFQVEKVPKYVQETDANGDPLFDAQGNPVYLQETMVVQQPVLDADGEPVMVQATNPDGSLKFDANGDPFMVQQMQDVTVGVVDEYGQPVYVKQTDPATGEIVYQTDDAGNYIYDYSKITGGNFSVSADVLSSVWNIAASSGAVNPANTNTPNTGNSEVLVKMLSTFEAANPYGQLNTFVAHLAITTDSCDKLLDTDLSLVNNVETQRQSLSSVSIDEETTNLIMYRTNYNAASRTISTIDEMLDKLINGTGRVGL
ncbi:MAG: flagellar hook-associated protein FlgK [Oscillospiraceae bacterium]|nr:flagellar hook-associated protein FlgK [Oscillospiraceae bacterium]